jgi:hypothetical protein
MSDRDGTVERELAALDTALATGVGRDEDPRARELQELALLLRADSATPDPAFAERLGERVRTGFPPSPAPRAPERRPRAHSYTRPHAAPPRALAGWRRPWPSSG